MTNEIIQGVAIALYDAFGDGYEIYQNDVSQGLQEPCFFIALIEDSRVRRIGKRWQQDMTLDIHYFPTTNGNNAEMCNISEQMFAALEFIMLPDGQMIHGFGMRSEIIDGALHFFVNYNVFLIDQSNEEGMESATVNTGIMGD